MPNLSTKYRPHDFDDVVGQVNTVKILKAQVAENKVAPVIGFFGASGCGKTTLARIIANKINKGKGHPIELDAASNNSVDNIRQIIESAKKRSLDSEYKVFIIDECHALSGASFQALLKLLEEPNPYTKFIFCTTNPEKIPDTVISRMQVFTFSKVSDDDIVKRLKQILNAEAGELFGGRDRAELGDPPDYEFDDKSLRYIVRVSNGSVRQSIANLEKVIAKNNCPGYDEVVSILGNSNDSLMSNLILSMNACDIKNCIHYVEAVYGDGKDMKQFVFDFIKFILDISKIQLFGNYDLTTLSDTEDIKNVIALPQKTVQSMLVFMTKFYENCKTSGEIRFLLESNLILWCNKFKSSEV